MILHFKGYGLLVPFVFLGCFVLAEMMALLTEGSGKPEWLLGAALLSAGVICWCFGNWLKHRGSLLQDLRKSRQVGPDDCPRSFYWIKMEWWGPILLGLGLLALMPALAHTFGGTSGAPSEPGSAANQSQPVQPAPSRASAPAGSGR